MSFNYRLDCNSKTTIYVNRDNINDAYFSDIKKYPILTEDEEHELIMLSKFGETEKERQNAKNKLVECNQRFVISVAKKLGTSETLLDLINEGNIGLMMAIDKFDVTKDCHLITYALSWIVAYIKNYQIMQQNSVVPPNALKLHNYVKRVTREFFVKNERNPTPHEIADIIRERYNFNISNLEDVELGRMVSIEEKYSVGDDNETIGNSTIYLQRTSTNNINENIEEEYKKHKLDFFLGKLDERERFIVKKFYGIGCIQESFDTIGLQINLGGERVRQICNVAVEKMKKYKKMVND